MFTFCIMLFILSCFFFTFPWWFFCCIGQRPCVNISKQMHFFPGHFRREPDVCLFSVLFYVIASGTKLHLTFCEQLTHTVWCCTKALCIIFVLLFCHLPLLSGDPVTIRDDFLLRGSLISSTSKVKPGRNTTIKSIPARMQSPSAALWKEKINTDSLTPVLSLWEYESSVILMSPYHFQRLVPYENFLSNFCILI